MTRKQKLIKYLTTNCSCWKGDDAKAELNQLPEERLAKMAQVVKEKNEVEEVVSNAMAEFYALDPSLDGLALNELPKAVKSLKGKAKKGATEDEEEMEDEEVVTGNSGGEEDLEAWLAKAPAQVRALVANAMEVEAGAKAQLIIQLTANKSGADKQAAQDYLKTKDLAELKTLASLLPAAPKTTTLSVNSRVDQLLNFSGAAGGPAGSGKPRVTVNGVVEGQDDEPEMLPLPTYNWAEMSKVQAVTPNN